MSIKTGDRLRVRGIRGAVRVQAVLENGVVRWVSPGGTQGIVDASSLSEFRPGVWVQRGVV